MDLEEVFPTEQEQWAFDDLVTSYIAQQGWEVSNSDTGPLFMQWERCMLGDTPVLVGCSRITHSDGEVSLHPRVIVVEGPIFDLITPLSPDIDARKGDSDEGRAKGRSPTGDGSDQPDS